MLLNLALGHVAHHRDHLDAGIGHRTGRFVDRTAAHFNPDKICALRTLVNVTPHTEFNAALVAAACSFRKRGQIGRTIRNMDAVKQPVLVQQRRWGAKQGFRRGRDEPDRSVAAMPGNHIADIVREKAIALLLDREQRSAHLRERFCTECQSGCVNGCRRDSEGLEQRAIGCRNP